MAVVGSSSASFCAGATWGILKSTNIDNINKIHEINIQGRVFSREPKRLRQLGHSREGLGDTETGKKISKKVAIFKIPKPTY